MTKYFTNNFSVTNLYKKPSIKSEIVTQMIYGDSFSVTKKSRGWLKIRIKDDNYKGFIQNKNYSKYVKPTHKISVLKARVYNFPNKNFKKNDLTFNSKIKVFAAKKNFLKFSNGWILKKNVKTIRYKEKNPFRKVKIFKNIKYKWGGKSFKGIDCSALVQVCLNFNNKYCPRDSKDQVNFFKKNIELRKIGKNNIIFWKGHVAIALSKYQLIHAYGPAKKTVVGNIVSTIKKIKKTANLDVIGIKKI